MSTIETRLIDNFLADLDQHQTEVLVGLVSGLNTLELVEVDAKKKARFSPDEIDLIGSFQHFVKQNQITNSEELEDVDDADAADDPEDA